MRHVGISQGLIQRSATKTSTSRPAFPPLLFSSFLSAFSDRNDQKSNGGNAGLDVDVLAAFCNNLNGPYALVLSRSVSLDYSWNL
ncbi:unnamed protein product [Arabis nemorensis]|uniref:Uncharacterized protein n=1 Tax=Arabis nemorensis TaxID=586526 RepID=A0A565CSM0_9BRAS|nr:unnamed protein product [Arabis nemorensis]